jgi:hypothetical protein
VLKLKTYTDGEVTRCMMKMNKSLEAACGERE